MDIGEKREASLGINIFGYGGGTSGDISTGSGLVDVGG